MSDPVLNLKNYSSCFINARTNAISAEYVMEATDKDFERIASLGGSETKIDTTLEIALLSRCAGVVNIRPVEAEQMLSKLTPKQQDEQLSMHVYKDMQIMRFLGNTKAVGYHDAVLQFDIIARGNILRTDIEAYYKQNIGAYVASIVDEEFNKISFLLEGSPNGSYNAILMRDKNNQYILSYEGYFNGTKQTKPFSITSLETLPSEMLRNPDFNRASIDQVKAQAALIPAVIYANARNNSLKFITDIITNFYINPNAGTYTALKDVYVLFDRTRVITGNENIRLIGSTYWKTLDSLNTALAKRVLDESPKTPQVTTISREQADILTLGLFKGN